jgi:hypothetical protein
MEPIPYSVHEINMGVLHVERIHNIIVALRELTLSSDQPTEDKQLILLKEWYSEIEAVLTPQQKKYATSDFITHFNNKPIVHTGTSLLIPLSTEQKMFEFKLWLFNMMYTHKLLTKIGVEYGHTEY